MPCQKERHLHNDPKDIARLFGWGFSHFIKNCLSAFSSASKDHSGLFNLLNVNNKLFFSLSKAVEKSKSTSILLDYSKALDKLALDNWFFNFPLGKCFTLLVRKGKNLVQESSLMIL